MRSTALFFSFVLLTATALPQQSVPAPPPPADTAPSLEATMKTIQDGMLGQHTHAGDYRAVQADPGNCTLSWTTVDQYFGKPLFTELKVSFNEIEKVSVAYDELAANWNLELYAAGKNISVHTYTQKEDVYPCKQCKKKAETRSERPHWFIYLLSEEQANRESDAILRAMKLCRERK